MCENVCSLVNISNVVVPDYINYYESNMYDSVCSHMNISDIVVPDYINYLVPNMHCKHFTTLHTNELSFIPHSHRL